MTLGAARAAHQTLEGGFVFAHPLALCRDANPQSAISTPREHLLRLDRAVSTVAAGFSLHPPLSGLAV
jgi:hypothetical protein